MLKDCVAILSIGSSNINLMIGVRGVNGTFIFRSNVSVTYYAFMNGEFADIKELEGEIVKLFDKVFIRRSNDVIPEILAVAETYEHSKIVAAEFVKLKLGY